jgi:hypothetical protein
VVGWTAEEVFDVLGIRAKVMARDPPAVAAARFLAEHSRLSRGIIEGS